MKRFLRSKLVLTLAASLMILAAIAIPLSGSITHSHAQAAPTITLSPTSGPTGTVVTVTGSGWNPGHLVDIRFGPSGPSIATPTVASDGTFSTTITIPSNEALGSLSITADEAGVNAAATFTVTAPRHQLFIFLQGIKSELTQKDITAISKSDFGVFNPTHSTITGIKAFAGAQFLEYSYPIETGKTGKAQQAILESLHQYNCADTFNHSIDQDVRTLDLQVKHALSNNPNTDIYLIGHSLGGVVALGYVEFLIEKLGGVSLPTGAALKSVITLDSPIGGVPSGDFITLSKIVYTVGASPANCNKLSFLQNLKSPDELAKVYATASKTTHVDDTGPFVADPQGAAASLLAIPSVKLPATLPFPSPNGNPLPTNQELAEEAQTTLGTSFLSVGNENDFLWNPQPCLDTIATAFKFLPLGIAEIIGDLLSSLHVSDFRNTQFLEDEGNGNGLYGRDFSAGSLCPFSLGNILNHLEVLKNSQVESGIGAFLNPVGSAPKPLNSTPPGVQPEP